MLNVLFCSILLAGGSLTDSTDVHSLHEVEVVQEQRFREVLPAIRLEGSDLSRLNVLSVADALHHFAGIQVRDYGGIGGIKTINVRSMGSQHTGIFYDGIELGNAQNGQIDLGQLSMDNIEVISVYHGQRSAIFQTASDFGHAGSVYLRTRVPIFTDRARHHLQVKGQYGSSSLLRIAGLWEQRLSSRHSLSIHAEGLSSNGEYRFRYRRLNYDQSIAYDTTAIRHNGDIQSLQAEVNLFGQENHGHWSLKAYTYHSNRGIPGAIVNNVWRRGERQGDHNTFIQGQWQRDISTRYSMRIQGKYANYQVHYVNRDSTQYMADNTFHQQEGYLSTSHVVELTPWWSVSTAYDYRYNHLEADIPLFHTVSRHQQMAALATAIGLRTFHAQASIMDTWAQDQQLRTTHFAHHATPALFVRWQPTERISLHSFGKQSYRLPTFNELYYTDMGNSQLHPETVTQWDLGLKLQLHDRPTSELTLTADIYHNHIKDKIVAFPKGQQFRWTMLNLGRVEIRGVDVSLSGKARWLDWCFSGHAQYTYQQAQDITSTTDPYYRHQIPYVPYHSGSVTLGADYGSWMSLCYSFTYVGERYSQQENIPYHHLQPWYTSDLNLQVRYKNCSMVLEVLNLLNQQYDVIANYPMPGVNYRCSIIIKV